jgi:hypothetical protein
LEIFENLAQASFARLFFNSFISFATVKMPVVVADILRAEFEGKRAVLDLCQRLRLIAGDNEGPVCDQCGTTMPLGVEAEAIDGFVWRCNGYVRPNKKKAYRCRKKLSIRTGTVFSGSHLTLPTLLSIMNYWCDKASLKMITKQCRINKETAVEWAKKFRKILLDRLVYNVSPTLF